MVEIVNEPNTELSNAEHVETSKQNFGDKDLAETGEKVNVKKNTFVETSRDLMVDKEKNFDVLPQLVCI